MTIQATVHNAANSLRLCTENVYAVSYCRNDESIACTRSVYVDLLVTIAAVIYNRIEEGV